MVQKCLQPPFPPLKALLTLGGWGGDTELAYDAYHTKVFSTLTRMFNWVRFSLVTVCLMKQVMNAAFVTTAVWLLLRECFTVLIVLVPVVILAAPGVVSDNRLDKWCTFCSLYRVFHRGFMALGILSSMAGLISAQSANADIIVEVLAWPCFVQVKVLPWGIFLLLIQAPIFANIGSQSGRTEDYLRSILINLAALCVRVLMEFLTRSVYFSRHFSSAPRVPVQEWGTRTGERRNLTEGPIPDHTISKAGSKSFPQSRSTLPWNENGASVVQVDTEGLLIPGTPEAIKVLFNGHDIDTTGLILPEEEASGSMQIESDVDCDAFKGLENAVSYDDKETGPVRPVRPIEEVIASIYKYKSKVQNFTVNFAERTSTVHIYVPWADPGQLDAGSLARLEEKLQNRFEDVVVTGRAVRKGSLIISLELLCTATAPAQALPQLLSSSLPTSTWLEWLDLPWPVDGEPVVVQVGDKACSMKWVDERWVIIQESVNSFACPSIQHASPQVHVLDANSTQDSVYLDLVTVGSLASASASTSFTDMSVLRGRSKGGVLHVHLTEQALDVAYSGQFDDIAKTSKCGVGSSDEESLDLPHVTCLEASIMLPSHLGCSQGVETSTGLIMLEVWRERMMLQSVPVLILPKQKQQIAWELERSFDSVRSESVKELHQKFSAQTYKEKAEMSTTYAQLGVWIQFVDKLKTEIGRNAGSSDDSASVSDSRKVKHCMIQLGCQLLELAVMKGWVHTACALLADLIETCSCNWLDVALGCNKDGQTLLHLAVGSGKSCMVAVAINWGRKYGSPWTWNVQNVHGVSPLHILACSGKESLVHAVLKHIPSSQLAWEKVRAGIGHTPQELSEQMGMEICIKKSIHKSKRSLLPPAMRSDNQLSRFANDTECVSKVDGVDDGVKSSCPEAAMFKQPVKEDTGESAEPSSIRISSLPTVTASDSVPLPCSDVSTVTASDIVPLPCSDVSTVTASDSVPLPGSDASRVTASDSAPLSCFCASTVTASDSAAYSVSSSFSSSVLDGHSSKLGLIIRSQSLSATGLDSKRDDVLGKGLPSEALGPSDSYTAPGNLRSKFRSACVKLMHKLASK